MLHRKAILAVALVVSSACAGKGRNYHDSSMDFGGVRTVAIMPLANLSREPVAADRVRDVLGNALLVTGALYVVPPGEVARALARLGIQAPTTPSPEEIVRVAQLIKADAVFTGVIREYGEMRSGSAVANGISLSLQLHEAAGGKVIWSASTTKGGVGFGDRLLGGGGTPVNDVTERAIDDLVGKLFN